MEHLDPDPWRAFAAWLTEAEAAEEQPLACALATASAAAEPSVRFVLLRGWDADGGLRFYTDRRSRKGADLAATHRAAVAFHWPRLGRQLRAHGTVHELDAAASLAYFRGRPRGSRLSAWASHQGQPIPDRASLERLVAEAAGRGLEDALPPHWGGYRLAPDGFEFWTSRDDRLHDRVEYRRSPDGSWSRRRLQP